MVSKFSVKDKVIVMEPNRFYTGWIGTIGAIEELRNLVRIHVIWDSHDQTPCWILPEHLKLLRLEPIIKGDAVRLTRDVLIDYHTHNGEILNEVLPKGTVGVVCEIFFHHSIARIAIGPEVGMVLLAHLEKAPSLTSWDRLTYGTNDVRIAKE